MWIAGMYKNLGRLTQEYKYTKGKDTIFLLFKEKIANITADRFVTYPRIVVDCRKWKEDPNRVRLTEG